ncbi:MAG: hypothetical protein NC215_00220 [Ruminococcus sp.]|nr:hypothetical protein [Ruminococcus sp.]
MAVTITKTETASYSAADGNLSGCVGGGTDYRTVDAFTSSWFYADYLIWCGWFGDNISSACKLVSAKLTNAEFRVRLITNTVTAQKCKARLRLLEVQGTLSGTKLSSIKGGSKTVEKTITISHSSDWQTENSFEVDFEQAFTANQRYVALRLDYTNDNINNLRCYSQNLQLEITRTRACYITFKGESITTKTTMYDYGVSVSFGSTPTRDGYTFKGWSNGSTTYTGTLPKAGEVDVTYTAVWEKTKYYLDLNGWINGGSSGNISQVGTADVYINGSLVSENATDYYVQHEVGTTYEIKNIKAKKGWKYDGVHSGTLTGTLNAAVIVVLTFSKNNVYADNENARVYSASSEASAVYSAANKIYG